MKRTLLILILPAALGSVACDDSMQPTQSAAVRTGASVTAAAAPTLSFTNTPLRRPDGNSEPEISIASNGTMAMVGLSLGLAADRQFGTSLWTGPFGSTPSFQGIVDSALQQPGRIEFGGEDADVDFGSTGTLHFYSSATPPSSPASSVFRPSPARTRRRASAPAVVARKSST